MSAEDTTRDTRLAQMTQDLAHLQRKVESMRSELSLMHSLLRDMNARQGNTSAIISGVLAGIALAVIVTALVTSFSISQL